jgi:lipoate---protein ligase
VISTKTNQNLQSKQIFLLRDSETRPEVNLAREDEIFGMVERGIVPQCVRFWTNQECLVKGRSKSPKYGWFDEDLANHLGIPVFERSTGGGVVYHDSGNLNWTFFLRTTDSFLSPRQVFFMPAGYVIKALKKLGLQAEFSPPNIIAIQNRKISGMAARSSINTLLVHGTLLFRSNLSKLNELCIPPPNHPFVSNLSEWKEDVSVNEFIGAMVDVLGDSGFQVIFREKSI